MIVGTLDDEMAVKILRNLDSKPLGSFDIRQLHKRKMTVLTCRIFLIFLSASLAVRKAPSLLPPDFPADTLTGFILFLPVALLVIILLWNQNPNVYGSRSSCGFVSIGTLVIVHSVAPWGFRQFGSYDLSLLVDLTWRYSQGQAPGRDFPATLPTFFMAIARVSTELGSTGWANLITLTVFITAALAVLTCYLLIQIGIHQQSILILMVVGSIVPWISTTHLWHSSITAQVSATTLLAAVAIIKRPSYLNAVLLGALMGVTALSKQNVAWFVFAGIVLLLLIFRPTRAHTALIWGGVLTFAFIIKSIAKVDLSYPVESAMKLLAERDRVSMVLPPGTTDWNGIFVLFIPWVIGPLLLMTVVFLVLLVSESSKSFLKKPESLFAGLAGASWLVGVYSNWDTHWNEFPIVCVGIILLLVQSKVTSPSVSNDKIVEFAAISLSVILLSVSLSVGASRVRMRYVGPLFEQGPLQVIEKSFLRGVEVGPVGISVVEADSVLASKHCVKGSNLLAGPRLEFLYAQWGIASPRGLPLWWHPGSSYSIKRDLPGILQSIESMRPIKFITLGDDMTRLPIELVNELNATPIAETVGPLKIRCLNTKHSG